MFSGRLAAAVLTLASCASLAACTDDDPGKEEKSASATDLGVRRDLPLDNACQWFTVDEVADRLEAAGAEVITGISPVENSFEAADGPGSGVEDKGDCWYLLGQQNRLVVTLTATREASSNWLERMKELEALGGPQTSEGPLGTTERTLIRVADAPTVQVSPVGQHATNCNLFAVTGETAVIGLEINLSRAPDGTAVCAAARAALTTLIERLPEDGQGTV